MTEDTDTDREFETTFEEVLTEVPDEAFDRSRFVPGAGPLDAALVFVGEAPGEREVEEGEPFVGSAGGRLDSILESLGIERRDLYITNLVKVRPPDNRDPHRDEIEAWRPVLDAEIEHVDPAVVVTLGNVPTHALLDTEEGISNIHGKRREQNSTMIIPTYHPAATFYDDSAEQAIEEDVRTAAQTTDLLEE